MPFLPTILIFEDTVLQFSYFPSYPKENSLGRCKSPLEFEGQIPVATLIYTWKAFMAPWNYMFRETIRFQVNKLFIKPQWQTLEELNISFFALKIDSCTISY